MMVTELSVDELMKIDVKQLIKDAYERTITPPKVVVKDTPTTLSRLRLKDIIKNLANSRNQSKESLKETS